MNIRGLAVRLTVFVWGLWAVAGCTSIDKRVEQLVLVGQFKEAREVLEADEAGAVVSAKAHRCTPGCSPVGGVGGFNDYFLTKLKAHPGSDKMLWISWVNCDRRLSFEVVTRRYKHVLSNDC